MVARQDGFNLPRLLNAAVVPSDLLPRLFASATHPANVLSWTSRSRAAQRWYRTYPSTGMSRERQGFGLACGHLNVLSSLSTSCATSAIFTRRLKRMLWRCYKGPHDGCPVRRIVLSARLRHAGNHGTNPDRAVVHGRGFDECHCTSTEYNTLKKRTYSLRIVQGFAQLPD